MTQLNEIDDISLLDNISPYGGPGKILIPVWVAHLTKLNQIDELISFNDTIE